MTVKTEMVEHRIATCDYPRCGRTSENYAVYTCAICGKEYCAYHVLGLNIFRPDDNIVSIERSMCRGCIKDLPMTQVINGINQYAWNDKNYPEDIKGLLGEEEPKQD